MAYSLEADVPSRNASAASPICQRRKSRWEERLESTDDTRAPSSPRSWNSGDRTARALSSPSLPRASRNIITPCVVLLLSVSIKVFVSRPTFFAISAGFLNSSIMVRCKAVADISTFWPCASSVAAKAIISGIVILAVEPMPAIRCANSTIKGLAAVQFCERWLTVEPILSIESRTPYICSIPKMLDSLAMVCVAPSPRSTSATLIIDAASTYSRTEATVL